MSFPLNKSLAQSSKEADIATNRRRQEPVSAHNAANLSVPSLGPPSPIIAPSSSLFSASFTPREEELQRLLAQERHRGEQRRNNYLTLKEEHLSLQKEYLGLQSEMKQILEETVYFKDVKKTELEHLLQTIEDKSKQIEKLEKTIRDNEPEVIRLRCAAELEEPMKRLQRENDRLSKDREKAVYDTQMVKQQLEHLEKEHLDSIERIRLSYEAEVNLVKREKEEIRSRLVEASQSPDVKRLVEMSEENSRLTRKLQSAQTAIEQIESQYREIQSRIEQFVIDQDQREKLHENDLKQLQEQIQLQKQEAKNLRKQIDCKKMESDELLEEIGRFKRNEEKLRFEGEQTKQRHYQEMEDLRRTMEKEKSSWSQDYFTLTEQLKKLKSELSAKDALVDSLQDDINSKSKEINDKVTQARKQELDKACLLEQKIKSLDTIIKTLTNEKQTFRNEIEKLRKQNEQQTDQKLGFEREIMILKAKLESQSSSIEDLEKIRRQHMALHDEVNRLRSENYDLTSANKELHRVGQNTKEEFSRLKELLDEERRNSDEVRLANDKAISKLARRYEDERTELRNKVTALERDSVKLQLNARTGQEMKQGFNEYNRLRAKQYAKIADRLNILLEQLRTDEERPSERNTANPKEVKENHLPTSSKNQMPIEAHNDLKRELDKIKRKQLELESCLGQASHRK